MLNPPCVDWRIVNYVHDGYIMLSRVDTSATQHVSSLAASAEREGKNTTGILPSLFLANQTPAKSLVGGVQTPFAVCGLCVRWVI